jgi:outer membrane immunogenic protein
MRTITSRLVLASVFLPVAGGAAQAAARHSRAIRADSPPPIVQRWDGFYAGAQGGYDTASLDFGSGTGSLIAYILRNTRIESEAQVSRWTTLPRSDTTGSSWGGFIGYNFQFENVVIGFEANYSRTSLSTGASDTIGRSYVTNDQYFYDIDVTSQASVHITDLATLRARAGWAYGSLLPYAMVGFAIARGDVVRSATVDLVATDISGGGRPTLGLTQTESDSKSGAFAYGLSAGVGFDWALMAGLFLRGEYEFLYFADFEDTKVQINTLRAAVGVKF